MNVILLILILGLSLLNFLDCFNDKNAKKFYKIQEIKSGDNTTFPTKESMVVVFYNVTFAESGKVINTYENFNLKLGRYGERKCLDSVVTKMSLGERIYFICPGHMAQNETRLGKDFPQIDVGYEIELLEIKKNRIPPRDEL